MWKALRKRTAIVALCLTLGGMIGTSTACQYLSSPVTVMTGTSKKSMIAKRSAKNYKGKTSKKTVNGTA